MNTFKASLLCLCALTTASYAGTEQKWAELPAAVRAAIVANGGKEGQSVDKENGQLTGQDYYEAGVKDKNGAVADLVFTADGKLVETKHDDADDRAKELEAQAKKSKPVKKTPTFSHPRDIYNPFVPMSYIKQDVLEGREGPKKVRVERTAKPDLHKTFKIGKQEVEALVVEDREWENGELSEVAVDYFAQADDGTVYYLGEDVDEYEGGKLKGHDGSWLLGKDTKKPGVVLPAHPKVGDKFKTEDVSKEINEKDEVISVTETVATPAGTYHDCVKVKEMLADGTVEYKYYAAGVGVVREQPADGDVLLQSHNTK